MRIVSIGLIAFMAVVAAQTTTSPPRTITATGTATVSAKPDQAMVDIGVTTQATTASDASTQNATLTTSVITAMQVVLGQGATIQTIDYSLNPVYSTGNNPTIIGYQVSNVVEATLTDLTLIGKVIDVSIAAGANRVNGIRFGLQNQDPVQAQALKQAAASALSQAKSIAAGLGVGTGNILRATEGVTSAPVPVVVGVAAAAPSTPIETGPIQVQGTVTVEVAIQ